MPLHEGEDEEVTRIATADRDSMLHHGAATYVTRSTGSTDDADDSEGSRHGGGGSRGGTMGGTGRENGLIRVGAPTGGNGYNGNGNGIREGGGGEDGDVWKDLNMAEGGKVRRGTVIAAGTCHSSIVDSAGRAWSWGVGTDGQLGHRTNEDEGEPREVRRIKEKRL